MTKEMRLSKMIDFYKTLSCENVDLPYYARAEHENFQDFFDEVENNGAFSVDIIYYSNAIKYLSENDTSLRESLGIAYELGYDLKNLSSEVLASLLASSNAIGDFNKLESEITDFFESLNEERDNEEEV